MSVKLLEPDCLAKYRELVGEHKLISHLSADGQRALFVHIDGLEELLVRERISVQRQAQVIRVLTESKDNARDPRQFVDFVLRHTCPERAEAHGFAAVHSIIKHHPFAKAHASPSSKGQTE